MKILPISSHADSIHSAREFWLRRAQKPCVGGLRLDDAPRNVRCIIKVAYLLGYLVQKTARTEYEVPT